MTSKQLAALLAFVAAASGAVGASVPALLRETPGAKVFYTQLMRLEQSPGNPDGGNNVSATVWGLSTLNLSDGGITVASIPQVAASLTAGQQTTVQTLLSSNAARSCLANGNGPTPRLLREATGATSIYVRIVDVTQTPLADAGNLLAVVAFGTGTLALSDGGTMDADIPGETCTLTGPQTTTLQGLVTGSATFLQSAP